MKNTESQQGNRKCKEEPNGYFRTEEYSNWNFKNSVDGLNSITEGAGGKSVN